MVKIINYFCGKCNVKIPAGEEFSLQLIDRENDHHITTDALKIEKQEDGIFKSKDGAYYETVVSFPTKLWEYTLCKKCFDGFDSQMRSKYNEHWLRRIDV